VETSGPVPTFSSRWCEKGWYAPSYQQSDSSYLTYLKQWLEQIGARVLVASSDGTIEVIRHHRELFERDTCVALAKESALAIATNKEKTLEVARGLGLLIPRGVSVEAVSDVDAAVHEIGLPAVVKPVESWRWGELQGARLVCKLVTSPDEARRAVEGLVRFGGSALFQQFLSGRREAISFLYGRDQIYARFAQWAKRTQPPLGGTSVLRQSIAIPSDIGEQAEHLIREIDLEGYSEVEFRRDDQGKPYLMEINPRLSASVEVAVRAGVDFPYLLYQWAQGSSIEKIEGYRTGLWMRHLAGDLVTTVASLKQHGRPGVASPAKALLDFWISFCIPMGYDYLDWKDPLPAWKASVDFASYLSLRAVKNLLGKRA
jgi:predicted ATP-grasp superfamily ATP-dependent carboligase